MRHSRRSPTDDANEEWRRLVSCFLITMMMVFSRTMSKQLGQWHADAQLVAAMTHSGHVWLSLLSSHLTCVGVNCIGQQSPDRQSSALFTYNMLNVLTRSRKTDSYRCAHLFVWWIRWENIHNTYEFVEVVKQLDPNGDKVHWLVEW